MYLRQLTAGAVEAGTVTDLYEAAGITRPDLSHLDEAFIERMQQTRNPHLAIEALRRLVEQEMRKVTRHNIVRQQSFSDRLVALMTRYTNQNLSAAQVIAELVAMAKEVSADANRGQQFTPALSSDELAFYDAVAQNESAVTEMGTVSWPTSPATWSSRCAATSPLTGSPATTSAPSSAPPSSACSPGTATRRRPARCHRTGPAPDGNVRRGVVTRRQSLAGRGRPFVNRRLRARRHVRPQAEESWLRG